MRGLATCRGVARPNSISAVRGRIGAETATGTGLSGRKGQLATVSCGRSSSKGQASRPSTLRRRPVCATDGETRCRSGRLGSTVSMATGTGVGLASHAGLAIPSPFSLRLGRKVRVKKSTKVELKIT